MTMTHVELLALIDQAADEGWTELDLSGQGLTELPPEIGKLTQLETLILGKVQNFGKEWQENTPKLLANQLSTLPPELSKLVNLRALNLSGIPLKQLPHCVLQLYNLEILQLTAVELLEVPATINYLKKLAVLDLSQNKISEISDAIFKLTSLKQLSLAANQITKIPHNILQLSSITDLYLQQNQIYEVPETLNNLQNLTSLNLSVNKIRTIPNVIFSLNNLEVLSLRDNQICEIPNSISDLQNLKEFYISGNQITHIPSSINQVLSLKTLSFRENQITLIPNAISHLKNLKELSLSKNRISKIPSSVSQLKNLRELYLNGNQIDEIPDSISQLNNLKILHIGDNQINEVPETIFQLRSLEQLYIVGNKIHTVSPKITQLQNLTLLTLGRNQLRKLPETIAQLQNLRQLFLHQNCFDKIPNALTQLKNIERLDLDRNQITEVPDWLESLPNLKHLDLRQNPLPISPEILGPANLKEDPGSVDGIFNYLRQLRSGMVRPLNEAKVLLVGQGSVGKTSLVNRLMEDRFDRLESQTDGLMVRSWMVQVNSKDVRLNVWDFGGQEIYHATHQFFLTKRSLYLLVCNCRTSEEENRLEYWLKLIQSFGGESPVIIVGNKSDEQPLDINRKALRTKYPNIKAILETSCQTREGIEDLKSTILQEVGEMNDVYNLLPLSWFEVKEQLERMDRDFISYSEYLGICFQHSIPEEQNQDQLIDLLHRLGLVLNFRNHPILQNTSVLNPDWVTEGIYALLSDESLRTEQKGILTHVDLSRVLDPQRYPSDRHHFLTQLMQEFQLCFALPHCTTPRFLIPGLLPKEEPEDISLEGDTLDFQYHYRILPESILSRFIVLSHEKIHNQTHWRSGVMLVYRESNEICNLARVRADFEDKKIFIAISGRETTRRIFLSILRDTFTTIHNSFGNLEVSEWVPVPDYPDHPPLDYQELLGLEAMGEHSYAIGKLRIRVDLRKLLDGYESAEARQRRQLKEKGIDIKEVMEGMRPSLRVNIHQTNSDERSRTLHQHGTGDNVAGDRVAGDKIVGES